MKINYVPLLSELRALYSQPRDMNRFRAYLESMVDDTGSELAIPTLGLVNPMGREHCLTKVEQLIALDADRVAAEVAAEASRDTDDIETTVPCSLVLLDDWKGGWTNRIAMECGLRRIVPPAQLTPRQARRFSITAPIWTSEEPTLERVCVAIKSAVMRTSYAIRSGTATNLSQLLVQEGSVAHAAQAPLAPLLEDELAWTRAVVDECAEANDTPTIIEILFGDAAAQTLGYAGKGLVSWAGLRLAQMEAADGKSGYSIAVSARNGRKR